MSENYCCEDKVQPRRYIQYNDLSFQGTENVKNQSESLSFRLSKTARLFSDGSYVANSSRQLLVDSNSISLQLRLRTNNWSADNITVHRDFIMRELMVGGKLWAIDTGYQLIWCNAYCTSIQSAKDWVATDDGYLVFNVEFDNPDGVWHKAKESHVYLEEWDLCDFTHMKADCLRQNSFCNNEDLICLNNCACCESSCKDVAGLLNYCEAQADAVFCRDFFEECDSKYRIIYNCRLGLDTCNLRDTYPIHKCAYCVNDVMVGEFFSDTVKDSGMWSVAIEGIFKNPVIEINGVTIKLKGEYNGVVTVDYKGNVRTAKSWECLTYNYKEVSLDDVNFCGAKATVHYGMNHFSVAGATSESVCLFLDVERLTV